MSQVQFRAMVALEIEGITDQVEVEVFADVVIQRELPSGYECDIWHVGQVSGGITHENILDQLSCREQGRLNELALDRLHEVKEEIRERRES